MNALISQNELLRLIEKKTPYTQEEMLKLASWSGISLANSLSGLSYSETQTVEELEGKNIYHYLNACRVAIGNDKAGMQKLLSSYSHASKINTYKEIADEEGGDKVEREGMFALLVLKHILSNGDQALKVKLSGQVPQKLFSFRQTTADQWFDNLVGVYGRVVANVMSLNGIDAATAVLFMQCAWHMHHAQPSKYPLASSDKTAVLDLFKKFVNNYGY